MNNPDSDVEEEYKQIDLLAKLNCECAFDRPCDDALFGGVCYATTYLRRFAKSISAIRHGMDMGKK